MTDNPNSEELWKWFFDRTLWHLYNDSIHYIYADDGETILAQSKSITKALQIAYNKEKGGKE